MFAVLWHESSQTQKKIQIPSKPSGACLNHLLIQGSVLQYPFLNPLTLPKIKQIVSNDDSVLALSESGLVYGWGGNQSNLLSPVQSPVAVPLQIPALCNIFQLSMSTSHAAAIDDKGLLYTWGCPLNGKLGYNSLQKSSTPELVLSSRVFKSLQVVCGAKFTSVRTDGCYVHIYGELGCSHAVQHKTSEIKSPKSTGSYSHPELDNYSIVAVSAGEKFLVALSDVGEVFVFDGCMDVVKLPLHSETSVLAVVAAQEAVWGLANDYLYHWRLQEKGRHRNYCELAAWSADLYETGEEVQVFAWGPGVLLWVETEICEPALQLRPYKRSEYARKLFSTALESPSMSLVKEDRVPVVNFEDLERLFPNGDSQHTMEKIRKIRIEHYQRDVLMKAFAPLVHPAVEYCLNKLKEYAWRIHLYRRTMKVSNLVAIFSSYLKQRGSMMKLKFLWRLKALNRIHWVVSKAENVKKIERSCEVIRNRVDGLVRSVFTAVKIRKPLEVVEMFRMGIDLFVRRDVLVAFRKWGRKVKMLKKLKKVFASFFRRVLKEGVVKLRISAVREKLVTAKLESVLGINENFLKTKVKFAFEIFKSSLTNTVLLNFHKKYVLELFLKLLLKTLSTKLNSVYSESFHSLQFYNLNKHISHPLIKLLQHFALKSKNSVFKALIKKPPKSAFASLKHLLSSRLNSTITQLRLVSSHKRIKKLALFSITIHKVLSNSIFKKKLGTFYKLKQRVLSRCQSLNDNEDDLLAPIFDTSSEISRISGSKMFLDPNAGQSTDVRLRQLRSNSSTSAIRRSHCCFRGSPAFQSRNFKKYVYYRGKKMTYEKYLVLKKVDELKDHELKSTLSPINTPTKKKIVNEKPPWKPASVYANSSATGQKPKSALKRGIEYNESLRKKLMKQRASNELSDSKQTVITHEKILINKPIRKQEPTPNMSNIVSLPMCKDTLTIGLATMVLERVVKKIRKRLLKDSTFVIKSLKSNPFKHPAPIPIDSPKVVQLKETLDMIKNDWQLGIIVIATDKIRLLMRKIIGKSLFDLFR